MNGGIEIDLLIRRTALANVQCPQLPSRSLYDARLLKLNAIARYKKGRAPQRDLYP